MRILQPGQPEPREERAYPAAGRNPRGLRAAFEAAGYPAEIRTIGGVCVIVVTLPASMPQEIDPYTLPPRPAARQWRVSRSARLWLLAGGAFAVLFGAFDISTWGHPERTIPRVFNWSQGTTAAVFAVCAVLLAVWWRLATGKPPAGYRPLVPVWLMALALAAVVLAVALAAWKGVLY